jgi:hypothetical protein
LLGLGKQTAEVIHEDGAVPQFVGRAEALTQTEAAVLVSEARGVH